MASCYLLFMLDGKRVLMAVEVLLAAQTNYVQSVCP